MLDTSAENFRAKQKYTTPRGVVEALGSVVEVAIFMASSSPGIQVSSCNIQTKYRTLMGFGFIS